MHIFLLVSLACYTLLFQISKRPKYEEANIVEIDLESTIDEQNGKVDDIEELKPKAGTLSIEKHNVDGEEVNVLVISNSKEKQV